MSIDQASRRVKYSKEFQAVYVRKDYPGVFLDRVPYLTETATEVRGEEYLVGVGALTKIYSPDMKIAVDGDTVTVDFTVYTNSSKQEQINRQWYFVPGPEHHATLTIGETTAHADGAEVTLAAAPERIDGIVYLPFTSLMAAMGAKVCNHQNKMSAVTYDETMSFDYETRRLYRAGSMVVRGKQYGDVYGCFWFEKGKRLIPYRLYIPTSYDPEKPNKAIFYFHGGGGNEDALMDSTDQYAQQAAERKGFVLVGTNGFIRSSFYGSLVPIVQTLDQLDPAKVDYDNPEGWPEETVRLRKLSLDCIHEEMEAIFRHVNLDKKNLFCTGNSAGSVACMHFALEEPELFRGICPTGGFINYNFYDLRKYAELHPDQYMMHICGTEDDHGFDFLLRGYAELDRLHVNYRKLVIGGANHSNNWRFPVSIEAMMDFFDGRLAD